jgi:hypothetical protein
MNAARLSSSAAKVSRPTLRRTQIGGVDKSVYLPDLRADLCGRHQGQPWNSDRKSLRVLPETNPTILTGFQSADTPAKDAKTLGHNLMSPQSKAESNCLPQTTSKEACAERGRYFRVEAEAGDCSDDVTVITKLV